VTSSFRKDPDGDSQTARHHDGEEEYREDGGRALTRQIGAACEVRSRRTGDIGCGSLLRSPHAVDVNIAITRTFVQLRGLMDANRPLAVKINSLEKKYDEQFQAVFVAIKQLIPEEQKPRRQIGFHVG
jgi:hypothetical protein